MSAAENIFLGELPRGRFGRVDWATLHERGRDPRQAQLRLRPPQPRLVALSIAKKQMVEIARAHFLIGGQFVAHPPGWPDNPVPSDDLVDYDVTVRPAHPIMQDVGSFRLRSEQYYMLVDPSNEVLVTTTFSGKQLWWIKGTTMPVAWPAAGPRPRLLLLDRPHIRGPSPPEGSGARPPRPALGRPVPLAPGG